MRFQLPSSIFIAAVCGSVWIPAASAQQSPTAPEPRLAAPGNGEAAAEQASVGSEDRFPALREAADRLKAIYEKVDAENMAEVDVLLRSRRCQINRVNGLLDRTQDAMRQWHQAELRYWKLWGDVEQERVDRQMNTLASVEADAKRAEELIEGEKRDREELLRRKDGLEKYGKRTEEIIRQIDELVQDIKDSEARLEEAQQEYDNLTVKIRNMQASITARLIEIRQNLNRVEAFGLQLTSYYEKNRATAQEICNTKQPNTQRTPLPKRKGN